MRRNSSFGVSLEGIIQVIIRGQPMAAANGAASSNFSSDARNVASSLRNSTRKIRYRRSNVQAVQQFPSGLNSFFQSGLKCDVHSLESDSGREPGKFRPVDPSSNQRAVRAKGTWGY